MRQWVVFRCHDRCFGFPLEQVAEIMPPVPFTRLPGTGAAVCGLAGVRGRLVTVFDMGALLGARSAAALPDHRLLLLEMGVRSVAVAVDDVLAIEPAQLTAAVVGLAPPAAADALLGSGDGEVGGFIALDPRRLLQRLLQ
jgi:purine-binding chemotaxis protein CheW